MGEPQLVAKELRLDIGDTLTGLDGRRAGHGAHDCLTAQFRMAVVHGHGHDCITVALIILQKPGDEWNPPAGFANRMLETLAAG